MVNTATIISFLVAPIVAILNFSVVRPTIIGVENAPGKIMKSLSVIGIVYLVSFSFYFIYTLFI
jgi:hypothetical protein